MKKVLITGANGMIGSALVEAFIDRYDLVLVSPRIDRISKYSEKARIIQKDIESISEWEDTLSEVDCVVHLAAAVHWTPKSEEEEKHFIRVNAEGTRSVYRASQEKGVNKFLLFSTNDVYKFSDDLIDESTPLDPKSVYGKSKLLAENYLLEDSKESNTQVAIFRPASVYGNNDKGSMKSLIKFCKKGVVPMLGKGENKKALLYLKDVINAVESYIKSNSDVNGEIFNISSGNYSYKEIIDGINKVYNFKPIKLFIPLWFCEKVAPKLGPLSKLSVAAETKRVSNAKAEALLGYKTEYSLVGGLKDAKGYYDN